MAWRGVAWGRMTQFSTPGRIHHGSSAGSRGTRRVQWHAGSAIAPVVCLLQVCLVCLSQVVCTYAPVGYGLCPSQPCVWTAAAPTPGHPPGSRYPVLAALQLNPPPSICWHRYPAGESYLDVIQRIEPVVIEMEREKECIVVVAHQVGGSGRGGVGDRQMAATCVGRWCDGGRSSRMGGRGSKAMWVGCFRARAVLAPPYQGRPP